jgi:hypothetical protein
VTQRCQRACTHQCEGTLALLAPAACEPRAAAPFGAAGCTAWQPSCLKTHAGCCMQRIFLVVRPPFAASLVGSRRVSGGCCRTQHCLVLAGAPSRHHA